jgi:hypothetical protein
MADKECTVTMDLLLGCLQADHRLLKECLFPLIPHIVALPVLEEELLSGMDIKIWLDLIFTT